jgi:hypothetical protein
MIFRSAIISVHCSGRSRDGIRVPFLLSDSDEKFLEEYVKLVQGIPSRK